jgi:hypothetical protein
MSEIPREAITASDAGVELADARRYAEALPFYERAAALAPDWYAVHLNLGIACKHTEQWARSLAGCLRAIELDASRAGSGALWNAGIAATALGDWPRARWAWEKLGIKLPEGEGPIDMNIGTTPIRISCNAHPEVVWCHRIDPARARIENIPTPETGRRYHDLLLHDGEPRGKRWYGNQQLSVFEELALLEASPFKTWSVDVVAPTKEDIDDLVGFVAEGSEAAVEDWTASLEILCKRCSEGVPHDHGRDVEPPWSAQRRIGIATCDDAVFVLIRNWARAGAGRRTSVPSLASTSE